MQVTDLKAILDYEHNEQWLAALNCYKGIWDHNPTDDVAIRYCFFCWYLIWQREQIDFPGEDISFEAKITVDNRMVVIPNGTLSNATITNVSNEPVRRVDVTVGIEYGEDIDRVKKILSDIVADNNDILKDREADIYVDALDASSVNMGIRVWTDSADYWKVKWAMLENIKKEFDKNGIAIPFNQLDVNVRTQQ